MKEDRDANFVAEDRRRPHRQPLAHDRHAGGLGEQQRSRLPDAQGRTQPRHARLRQSGACLTRPDGGRSCPDVWPWSDDESLGRHQECRHRPHHGRQRRRSAPVRLQVGDRGEGAQQGASSSSSTRASRARHRWPTSTRRSAPAPTSSSSAALINYLLTNDKIQHEYVKNYTDFAFLVARGLRVQRRHLLRLRRREAQLRQIDLGLRARRRRLRQDRSDARSIRAASTSC